MNKMAKPRLCPNCSTLIPIDRGFTFDENLNMRCSECGEVVVPSKADAQVELDFVLKKNRKSSVKTHSLLDGQHPTWKNDLGDY